VLAQETCRACHSSRGQQRGSPGRVACACELTGLWSRDDRRTLAAKVRIALVLPVCITLVLVESWTDRESRQPTPYPHDDDRPRYARVLVQIYRRRPRFRFPPADEPVRSWDSALRGTFSSWETCRCLPPHPAPSAPPAHESMERRSENKTDAGRHVVGHF
jgi:hypothetical protein